MTGMIELGTSAVPAYLSEPAGVVRGAVVVIHEVWGLVEHIKDVADRFAAEGYVALAPDLFGDLGAFSGLAAELQRQLSNPDARARTAAQPRLRELMAPIHSPEFSAKTLATVQGCFDHLAAMDGIDGRVGVVGFCFGGTQAFGLAVVEPRLRAAVPFYGNADFETDRLRSVRAPILAFYGEQDARLVGGLGALTVAMDDAGVDFRPRVFPGCGHAFFNDSNPYAYNADAAQAAWSATIEFLGHTLGTQGAPKG